MSTAQADNAGHVAELRALVPPEAFLGPEQDLSKYEKGWRYGHGKALAVVRPATTAEVSTVIAWCHRRGVRVVPQGANTGLVAASTPDGSGAMLVLSLERLNRRLEIDPIDRTVLADGGVLASQLDAALEPHGLVLPIDLGADPTIGGMVATNTGGARLLRYGDLRRSLLGVELVLGDGRVVDALSRLRKKNTGLDLAQLVAGTFGALGVVTGAVLSVVPRPRQRVAAWVGATRGEAVLALLARLETDLGEAVTAFEVLSRNALEATLRRHPALRNPFGGAELPAFSALVELTSTLPAEALDLQALLEATLGGFLEDEDAGLSDVFFGKPDELWAIRHSVSESLGMEGKVLAFDVSVPRSRIAAFTADVTARLAQSHPEVRVCDFGHWGDGGTHLNLLYAEPGEPAAAAALVEDLQRRVYALVVEGYSGSYSAEHGVGPHNQTFYDRYTPEAIRAISRAVKGATDPGGILSRVSLG
jgi:FAD/FMN-containing dehydrogenase